MATSILPGTTRSGGHARTYKLGAGLRMRGATSGKVGILPPATITDYDLTLPGALAASDKLLQVSSAGVVSLVDPVTIGGTGTELLYRGGASSAAAVAGSSWNGTTLTLPGRFVNANGYGFTASGTCTFFTLQGGTTSVAYIGSGGIYVGSPAAISATPAAGYLYGTGGSGTNVVGGTLYIAPGPSTGNATPSSIILQSSVAGSSGSTAQTLVDTLTVTNGKIGIGITPTVLAQFSGADATGNDTAIPQLLFENRTSSGTWNGAIVRCRVGTGYVGGFPDLWLEVRRTNSFGIYTALRTVSNHDLRFLTNDTFRGLFTAAGLFGVNTTAPDRQVEINATDGNCLRLTYNDSNGSAAYYSDFAVSAAGNLTITPSGGLASLIGDFAVASTNYHYWGASNVDGSWRIGRSGNDIVIERRESGVWVTKSTISA